MEFVHVDDITKVKTSIVTDLLNPLSYYIDNLSTEDAEHDDIIDALKLIKRTQKYTKYPTLTKYLNKINIALVNLKNRVEHLEEDEQIEIITSDEVKQKFSDFNFEEMRKTYNKIISTEMPRRHSLINKDIVKNMVLNNKNDKVHVTIGPGPHIYQMIPDFVYKDITNNNATYTIFIIDAISEFREATLKSFDKANEHIELLGTKKRNLKVKYINTRIEHHSYPQYLVPMILRKFNDKMVTLHFGISGPGDVGRFANAFIKIQKYYKNLIVLGNLSYIHSGKHIKNQPFLKEILKYDFFFEHFDNSNLTHKHRKRSDWILFLKENKGSGRSIVDLSSEYRQTHGVKTKSNCYKKAKKNCKNPCKWIKHDGKEYCKKTKREKRNYNCSKRTSDDCLDDINCIWVNAKTPYCRLGKWR